jgi:hypothetical protein
MCHGRVGQASLSCIAPLLIRAGPCPSVVKKMSCVRQVQQKMAGVADTLCSMRSLRFNISAVRNLRKLAQFADKNPVPFPVSTPLCNHPFSLTSLKSKSPMKTRFSCHFFVLVSRFRPIHTKFGTSPRLVLSDRAGERTRRACRFGRRAQTFSHLVVPPRGQAKLGLPIVALAKLGA